jgi:intracellular sulfur oxidation DsrE/DsrF family protein
MTVTTVIANHGFAKCKPGRHCENRFSFLFREFVMRFRFTTIALLCLAFASSAFAADTKPHRVAIQVNQNDPQVMNLALNNVTNVIEYYRAKKEDVDVEVVAYGPGLHMLRADTSPVQERIKHLKEMVFPGKIQFSACNVSKAAMEKREGKAVPIVAEASVVPSGVVHLMELQEQGWSYVRP